MADEYISHNLFRKDLERFLKGDPHLVALEGVRFTHPMDWWRGIDWRHPGIYLLTGGRQIGKTTSTKLLIKAMLLNGRFAAERIFYLPCDQIEDHVQLGQVIRGFHETLRGKGPFLLIVDEVTYVKEWDRAIKAVADEGMFHHGFCIITGSDSIIIKDAMTRFPGRRGEADRTDFCLRPLDFREYVELVDPEHLKVVAKQEAPLLRRFEEYLKCGGHLRAINDLHGKGDVLPATYAVFEQWIRGDFSKRGKAYRSLVGVVKALLETSGSQVTYSSLAQRMGELSKPAFMDYCDILERMDVFFSLEAFDQNRRIGFPKKARKFHVWDPFIFDTLRRWLEREGQLAAQPETDSLKAESIVAAHFRKRMSTYYSKGKGEIDVVAVSGKRARYIEVKWTGQGRRWDLGELQKRRNALLLTKTAGSKEIDGIPTHFLPQFLIDNA